MYYGYRGKTKSKPSIWAYGTIFIDEADNCFIVSRNKEFTKVEPNTVGRCLDFRDTTGVELYEGDILKIVSTNKKCFGATSYSIVGTYLGNSCLLDIANRVIDVSLRVDHAMTLVGNMFDNKDILKELEIKTKKLRVEY